ncbi:MAG: hypothetical protein ACRDZN_07415 [Acidimicrobiales bacterium]
MDFELLEVLNGDAGTGKVTVLVPTLILNGSGEPVTLRSYGAQDIPADLVGHEFLIFVVEVDAQYAFMGEDGVTLIEGSKVVDTPYAPSDAEDPLAPGRRSKRQGSRWLQGSSIYPLAHNPLDCATASGSPSAPCGLEGSGS